MLHAQASTRAPQKKQGSCTSSHAAGWEVAIDRDRDDPDWRADYTNKFGDRGNSRWLNLAGGVGFHGERFVVLHRVGKKNAGRLLDGVQHDGVPE